MEPKFIAQIWAVFKVGNGYGMGQIVGATKAGVDQGWLYFITNAAASNTYSVSEGDITHTLKDEYWRSTEPANDIMG